MKSLFVMFLATLLCLSACAQATPAPDNSLWGAVIALGNAEQTAAPALALQQGSVYSAWVGADASGVHHDMRALTEGNITPRVVLPLPPRAPRDNQLHPAGGDGLHLLWLDVDDNGNAQLYNALIEGALGVFRGPLPISDGGAWCYDSLEAVNGALWVAWYGGDVAQPALYSALIDPTGLHFQAGRLFYGGGCPTFAQTLTARMILWGRDDGQLYGGEWGDGQVIQPHALTVAPTLQAGDRLRSLTAGGDAARVYAFWNITRADGHNETWFTHGLPEDSSWGAPRLLQVRALDGVHFETTLNTGVTVGAQSAADGARVAWANPLDARLALLPVAATVDDSTLAMLYFADGELVGYQAVVGVAHLLGTPTLALDQARHVYLTWSEPSEIGAATLHMTATRTLLQP
ncbi:MAG: hypothetical protein ACOYL5_04680 [Phototrophicaceae bacterium]